MNRYELNQKYCVYGIYPKDNCSKDELTKYYKNYQRVLVSLIKDIKEFEKNAVIANNKLNERQMGCIKRCSEEFVFSAWKESYQKYTQAFYELTDFIYYPGYEYNDLSQNELDIIRVMASYLILKADELIHLLK